MLKIGADIKKNERLNQKTRAHVTFFSIQAVPKIQKGGSCMQFSQNDVVQIKQHSCS